MFSALTALVYMLLCLVLATAMFSPLLLHAVTLEYLPILVSLPKIDLYVAVSISAAIALVVIFVFYRIALTAAEKFLTEAEV